MTKSGPSDHSQESFAGRSYLRPVLFLAALVMTALVSIAGLTRPLDLGLRSLQDHDGCFYSFAQDCADRMRERFLDRPLPEARLRELQELAAVSLRDQATLEAAPQLPFDDFLAAYFA